MRVPTTGTLIVEQPGVVVVLPIEGRPITYLTGTRVDQIHETCSRIISDVAARDDRIAAPLLEFLDLIEQQASTHTPNTGDSDAA
jgi:hypothetical protein